jgi:hypothetical protein
MGLGLIVKVSMHGLYISGRFLFSFFPSSTLPYFIRRQVL